MTALELVYYCFPKLVHAVRVRGNDNFIFIHADRPDVERNLRDLVTARLRALNHTA